ncbi:NAD-dependent epimerase/dehydratase family protein [Streptomyces sp. NBC_01619]|uniref:NAD-dependent epimerase/dehydratase family protein n=1 Tax=Streptomyces sp. NBC_01619 TaxID=2975901 RepID=UPI0022563736|nr:NAD-dependent epimerase/dehydratase family protein [Streptomyces sp. NBC_01619]MCX4515837.1 NAD-dependent epimerase/dehydratase family protein [Streptomyces sp. NBC_01619]
MSPLFVTRLLKGQPVTLHGQGQHMRNWLHVQDNCAGVETELRHGAPGEDLQPWWRNRPG